MTAVCVSVMVTLRSGDLRLGGGGLHSEYGVWQYHFHWGSSDQWGSEHTIDGKPYPLEVWIFVLDAAMILIFCFP
jgi:carbonic anhydrase